MKELFDVLVVGGGVVGCAMVRHLGELGLRCLLVEKESCVVAGVSSGNTGIACTTEDVDPGTVEWECLKTGTALNLKEYQRLGVPHRPGGVIYIAWTAEEVKTLQEKLRVRQARGDTTSKMLSRDEVIATEPNVDSGVCGGLLVAGEVVVDPWLVSVAWALDALFTNNVSILVNATATGFNRNSTNDTWEVVLTPTGQTTTSTGCAGDAGQTISGKMCALRSESSVFARVVVNCAGLFGDEVEKLGGFATPFTIAPRRGDFVLLEKPRNQQLLLTPIGQCPTPQSRGVYIWQTIHGHIAIGPTAQNVPERKVQTPPAQETIDSLVATAVRCVPGLKGSRVIGTYSGLRPASKEHGDYHILARAGAGWVCVGGIRSTGLTASRGIAIVAGTHVLAMLGRGDLAGSSKPKRSITVKLPSLEQIRRNFHERGDGCVDIAGHVFTVTHPIAKFGLASSNPHTASL